MRRHTLFAAMLLSALAACSDDDSPADADAGTDAGTDPAVDTSADVAADTRDDASDGDTADVDPDAAADADTDAGPPPNPDCDPLDPSECALPWPSNLYLEADGTRETGYTLAFGETSLPANYRGVHIAPDDYRRLDGFGPSTPIIVHLPNLDASGLADDGDPAPSMADDAPIRLYRVVDGTLEREPYFAELDAWETDAARQVLYVRPARLLDEASHYVVAFLNTLRDTDGAAFEPSEAFRALRDDETTGTDLSERQASFDAVFTLLDDAGVSRDELLLAWDFRTASSDALHGRMLEIRREGLAAADDDGLPITITSWEDFTVEEDDEWASLVRGTVTMPHFMKEDIGSDPTGDVTGWTFADETEGDGLVGQNGTREVEFWLGIPHSASDGTAHGLMQHGHGFFGLGEGATGSWNAHGALANAGEYIVYGGNWTGMSEYDFGNIQFAVFDLNYFRWLPDRTHQGLLEFILLEQAIREGLGGLTEFTDRGYAVDTTRSVYEGISQGGIYGATYMALTPTITRGHLAVPGQNYALLAHRSQNFDEFFLALAGAYPGRARQAIVMATVQMLWDTVDPATYYRHIAEDPFEDDGPRDVLLTPSLGDYSVTELSIEIVARTLPSLPVLGTIAADVAEIPMATAATYPHTGSGIVFYSWDGVRRVHGVNRPAPRGEGDPHGDQRWLPAQQQQMLHFFDTGEIIDTCGGDGCTPE